MPNASAQGGAGEGESYISWGGLTILAKPPSVEQQSRIDAALTAARRRMLAPPRRETFGSPAGFVGGLGLLHSEMTLVGVGRPSAVSLGMEGAVDAVLRDRLSVGNREEWLFTLWFPSWYVALPPPVRVLPFAASFKNHDDVDRDNGYVEAILLRSDGRWELTSFSRKQFDMMATLVRARELALPCVDGSRKALDRLSSLLKSWGVETARRSPYGLRLCGRLTIQRVEGTADAGTALRRFKREVEREYWLGQN
jgi:hypothetical protein